MNRDMIFNLNKLADEYEAKAQAYRAVANDLMNGQPAEHRPRKKKVMPRKGIVKGHKYNGKHWMQRPENRVKMMKRIKAMHIARSKMR